MTRFRDPYNLGDFAFQSTAAIEAAGKLARDVERFDLGSAAVALAEQAALPQRCLDALGTDASRIQEAWRLAEGASGALRDLERLAPGNTLSVLDTKLPTWGAASVYEGSMHAFQAAGSSGLASFVRGTAFSQSSDGIFRDHVPGIGLAYEESVRALKWAESLGVSDRLRNLTMSDGIGEAVRRHLEDMEAAAAALRLAVPRGIGRSVLPDLVGTQAKLSVLAGTRDAFGFESAVTARAYRSLLGEWHTRSDLPSRYWEDASYRRDLYRDADVDEGLAEAGPEEVLELFVDSGFAYGATEDGGTVVTFRHAGLTAVLSSTNIDGDAHRMVSNFENRLRQLVGRRMETRFGQEWLKHRAPGDIFGKAKQARHTAYKSGEPRAPLICFTNLGDLKEIIKRTDNWEAAFESVFRNRDDFSRDMDKLSTFVRNPNSHSRTLDGPRFLEIVHLIERLSEQIEDDGRWLEDAGRDH